MIPTLWRRSACPVFASIIGRRLPSKRARQVASSLTLGIAAFSTLVLWPGSSALGGGDEPAPNRRLDLWGRFSSGSWKLVRSTTESLDSLGNVASVSTTETRTTVVKVTPTQVTLKVEVTVETNGRRFRSEPQTIVRGFLGERPGQQVSTKSLGEGSLTIGGRDIRCLIREVSFSDLRQSTVATEYVSEGAPHSVLLRKSKTSDEERPRPIDESTVEVVAVDMPHRIAGEIKLVNLERGVQKTSAGTIHSLDVTSAEVPGGVVSRSTKELDANGAPIRRGTVELVGYHVAPDDAVAADTSRRRLFSRDRYRSR